MRNDSAEILFQSFLQEALVSSFGMDRDVHSLSDVVHPAFPLLTTASPTLRGALKDGFGEAVVACDMLEPCKIPSLDGCRKEVPEDKEVDLAPHPVVVLCSKQEIRRSFLMRLVSKAWILYFRVSKQGPCFSMIKLSLLICTKNPAVGYHGHRN